jgi:L,D-transpeptidase YcbB
MLLVATGAMGMAACAADVRPQAAPALELKLRIEQLRELDVLVIGGAQVHASTPVPVLYEQRSFAPLWVDPRLTGELVNAIRDAELDGLDPADYHLEALDSLLALPPSPAGAADLEILATDAILRLARHLRFGKVDPDPGFRAPAASPSDRRMIEIVIGAVGAGSVAESLQALAPDHFVYRGLKDALAELRRIEGSGGWERIPAGPTLRLGGVDERVPLLRRRLAGSGDLPGSELSGGSVVDAALESAVRRFQHRHGLNEDGVVGPATLAELNVPVHQRIRQVRLNLERARWITHDLPDTFVTVNIAGAKVYLVRDAAVVFESRAIVGRPYTRTPIFRESMRYIDLNPTWTVPPGIVGEVLAEIRRNPGYLARLDMEVLDRGGRRVEISPAALSGYSASTFPYVFRQRPGPLNPLGRIKFMFPNRYNVYLHDTPARVLFEQEERTFSHGCIRVQDPLRLAELILNDPVRWNRSALLAAVETERTRSIPLATQLPVLILYWTAAADLHGELHFYRDVYGRDNALLEALERR